jgi:hypothetical protein
MKINKHCLFLPILAILLFLVLACGFSPEREQHQPEGGAPGNNNQPGAPLQNQPPLDRQTAPYIGLWVEDGDDINENRVFTFTGKTVYLVEPNKFGNDYMVREELSNITAIDTTRQIMTLKIQWIRANGKMGGSDLRIWYLKYEMDGDRMRIATSRNDAEPVPDISSAKTFERQ